MLSQPDKGSCRSPDDERYTGSPLDRLIGGEIRRFRVERVISQTELGTGSGITFQRVQKYENGTNRVTVARLAQIAQTLGVPLTAFFADFPGDVLSTGRVSAELSAADQIGQSAKGLRLVTAFVSIPSKSTRTWVVQLFGAMLTARATGWMRSDAPTRSRLAVRAHHERLRGVPESRPARSSLGGCESFCQALNGYR